MAKTYGVLSDLHNVNVRVILPTIQILIDEETDALVLNGDLIGDGSQYNSKDYFATVLDVVGKSGLETYVLPGSHENVQEFEPVLAHFVKKYQNIINTLQNPKVETPDHHLIFLQGSDWRSGNAIQHGYSLEDKNETGLYQNNNGLIRVINMNDLKKLATNPEKTIVFSHIPRKFYSIDTSVDLAEFGEATQSFRLDNSDIKVGSIFPIDISCQLVNQGAPIVLKKENRGNDMLKTIYEELGIKKNVTGHFHESASTAHDSKGDSIEEGSFVNELFYNASWMDSLIVGMLTVADSKVAYENINLRKYFR